MLRPFVYLFLITSELFYDGELREIKRIDLSSPNDPPKGIRVCFLYCYNEDRRTEHIQARYFT